MRAVRHRLSWLLASWLVFQVAATVAPAVLAATGLAEEAVCTCPGTEHGATCPMHHDAGSPATDPSRCAMRNASSPSDVALLSFSTGACLVPGVLVVDADHGVTRIPAAPSKPLHRTELPDFPPPRS